MSNTFNLDTDKNDISISEQKLSDDISLLKFSGIIDTYNSQAVQREVGLFIENNKHLKCIIFDFEKITYVSSTGIGSIVHFYKAMKENDIDLYLMKVGNSVKGVFSLLGFSSLFNYIEDVGDIKKVRRNIFPKEVECPKCKKKFRVIKSGAFKCSGCKHIFRVNSEGEIVEN